MPFVQRQSGFTKHSKFGHFKCNNYFGFVIILGQTLVTMNFDYLIKIIKDEMMTALTYLCHPVKNTKIFKNFYVNLSLTPITGKTVLREYICT